MERSEREALRELLANYADYTQSISRGKLLALLDAADERDRLREALVKMRERKLRHNSAPFSANCQPWCLACKAIALADDALRGPTGGGDGGAMSDYTMNDLRELLDSVGAESLESLRAERYQAQAEFRDMKRRWLAVQDESNKKSARIAELEAALRKYGRHGRICNAPYEMPEGGRYTCTCGLAEVLNAVR